MSGLDPYNIPSRKARKSPVPKGDLQVRQPNLKPLLNDPDKDTIRVRDLKIKRKRKLSLTQIGYGLTFGVVALALIVWVGFLYYTSTPEYKIRTALEYVARADVAIVQVDDIINSEITLDTAAAVVTARSGIDGAKDSLRKGTQLINEIKPRATAPQKRRITLLGEAITARMQMLSLAPPLLAVTESSAQALIQVADAWDNLTLATQNTAKGIRHLKKLKTSSMKEALEYHRDSVRELQAASGGFKQAQESFSEVDFTLYIDYLALRKKMSSTMVSACKQWLAGDKSAFSRSIESYNGLSRKARKVETANLRVPSEEIVGAYKTIVGTINEEYFAIRAKVLQVDSLVR